MTTDDEMPPPIAETLERIAVALETIAASFAECRQLGLLVQVAE